jgi:hypothetical protein
LDVKENAEFTAFTYTDPPLPLAMHSEKVFPLRLSPVVARVVDRYTPPPFPVAAADVMEEEEERSNVTTFDAYTAPPWLPADEFTHVSPCKTTWSMFKIANDPPLWAVATESERAEFVRVKTFPLPAVAVT